MDPPGGQVTTPIDEFGDYAALDPFFRIIEEGLAGFVDDGHFFDLLAEDVIFAAVTRGDVDEACTGIHRDKIGRQHMGLAIDPRVMRDGLAD